MMNKNTFDLSFFDCNAFIGKHINPYTESLFGAEIFTKVMKASGISKSMIYHSAAVSYDPSFGNKLLVDEVKNREELFPVWIAVPEHFYTENDAENFFWKMKKNKISAIKLFPRYHNFTLVNGAMDNLFTFFDKEEIPILVNQEDISWEEINYILERFKKIPLLLQNVAYQMERFIVPLFNKYNNIYLDISRYHVYDGVEYICNRFGSERLLFGSGMPVFSPEPIMMMVENAKISFQEKQNISSQNLLRILKNDK